MFVACALMPQAARVPVAAAQASSHDGAGTGTRAARAATDGHAVYLPMVTNPAPLSDQELIGAALAAGQIDYGTSLLYRAYAFFGDPRLPAEFRGDGSIGEDPTLFAEMTDSALPADVQARLRPFVARPDNPDSVFNAKTSTASRNVASTSSDLFCDINNWTALASLQSGVKVKVHAQCTGDYEGDIRAALGMIEALWGPMTDLMGQPIPDTGGADGGYSDDIDLYLVEPLGVMQRAGGNYQIPHGTMAAAWPAKPETGTRSSGLMLLNRHDLGAASFKSTLAHEFFHVLQNAHNSKISFNNRHQEWWFIEASATWAEAHFVPETSAQEVHERFAHSFQTSYEPLHLSVGISDPKHYLLYAAYIWPFFMEQERGAEAIAAAWRGIESAGTDWDLGLDAINTQLPFAQHFHEFAIRNLNRDLEPNDPITPRYIDLDPLFPDGAAPWNDVNDDLVAQSRDAAPLSYDAQIPALKARYYHFTTHETVRKIELDLSSLAQYGNLRVDVVKKSRETGWEIEQLEKTSKARVCDVDEFYLVVTNHATNIAERTPLSFTVRPLEEYCNCGPITDVRAWNARITFSYKASGSDDLHQISTQSSGIVYGNVTGEMPAQHAPLTGTTSVDYSHYMHSPTGLELLYSYSGSGPPTPLREDVNEGSRVNLNFNLDDCTFNFNAGAYVYATDNDGHQVEKLTGGMGSKEMPLPTTIAELSGGGEFAAHSPQILQAGYEGDWFVQNDWDLTNILGEDNQGHATVTWSFTPVDPPPDS
jgi:hypothetical protein